MSARVVADLVQDLDAAEAKAWDALARYKFMMFGYWAAIWVHQNRVGRFRRPNPWLQLVQVARVWVKLKGASHSPTALPLLDDEAA